MKLRRLSAGRTAAAVARVSWAAETHSWYTCGASWLPELALSLLMQRTKHKHETSSFFPGPFFFFVLSKSTNSKKKTECSQMSAPCDAYAEDKLMIEMSSWMSTESDRDRDGDRDEQMTEHRVARGRQMKTVHHGNHGMPRARETPSFAAAKHQISAVDAGAAARRRDVGGRHRAVLALGLVTGIACAQAQAQAQAPPPQRGTWVPAWLAELVGSADRGDPSRWVGGIDRGGTTRCRLGAAGSNCSSPANCVFNLSAREEHLRSSFCIEERMERPYLGVLPRGAAVPPPTAGPLLPVLACAPPRVRRRALYAPHRRTADRGCAARAGKYIDNNAQGVYTCGCCNATLFHSSDKFDSRRGYLSFWSQAAVGNVGYKHHEGSWLQHPLDTGLHCEHCGAHLGLAPRPAASRARRHAADARDVAWHAGGGA